MGAVYAALLFLPGLEWLGFWPCKVASGVLMPLVAFGRERALFRVTLLFFGASAGLAGLVIAVESLGGAGLTVQNGVLYSAFDLRLLLLLFVGCYFVMSLFFRRMGAHCQREMIELRIVIQGQTIVLTALLDSGHTLTDPVTNLPIVIADASCITPLLSVCVDPSRPVESIKRCRMAGISGARLVPYRAVGVDCGMLLAIKSASVASGDKQLGGLLIALSPNPVDDGGGYQALIGGI